MDDQTTIQLALPHTHTALLHRVAHELTLTADTTTFLKKSLPPVSIVRPTKTVGAALTAFEALVAEGLFRGQSKGFIDASIELAKAADAATREH